MMRAVTGPLYAIGRFCSRHHYLVIGAWILVAAVLVVAGQRSEGQTNNNLTLPGTGSTTATELLEDNLPAEAYGANPLTIVSDQGSLAQRDNQEAIAKTVTRLEAIAATSAPWSIRSGPKASRCSAATARSSTYRSISASARAI